MRIRRLIPGTRVTIPLLASGLFLAGHRVFIQGKGKNDRASGDISKDLALAYSGDANRIRQILLNILNNAIKFTESGKVILSASSTKLENGDCEIHFVVKDTGIGIPKEKMSRLFHPFSQVDASTARKYGGTGLGLTISKRIVEMMNGRIWAESQVGIGSAFHFTIQAKPAISNTDFAELAAADSQLSCDSGGKHNLSILLAEDIVFSKDTFEKFASPFLYDLLHPLNLDNVYTYSINHVQ